MSIQNIGRNIPLKFSEYINRMFLEQATLTTHQLNLHQLKLKLQKGLLNTSNLSFGSTIETDEFS